MKLASYLCELCNQDKREDEVLLVNYPDPEGSGLVIPNFVSGLTDGQRFTPTDTEFEDKPNGRQ